jgi:hypothetical protein
MIREHDCVVLTEDLAGAPIKAGDVGTVVHVHRAGKAFEVEVATLTGATVAVATALHSQVRPITSRDVSHVRELRTN